MRRPMPALWCCCVIGLAVGLTVAATGPAEARLVTGRDEMQNPGLPVQQPDHILAFPKTQSTGGYLSIVNSNEVYDIALTPDGGRLVYTQDSEVLNGWYVVLWVWPEIVLTLLGLAVLWGLWKTLRRRVRSRDTDSPVCARCGYATRGLTRDTCPECGSALGGRGTTVGLTRGNKRARLLLLAGIAAGAGTAYYFTDPPRFGQVSTWIDWRSEGLADRARRWDIAWMERLIQATTAVRDVPVHDSSDVHTIVHVPQYQNPMDLFQVMRGFDLMIGGYPRPYANDRLHTNQAGTLAIVNNEYDAVRIDLATLEHTPAPGMVEAPHDRWYHRVLDDTGEGSYRFQYYLRMLEGTDQPDVTLIHSERGELSYTVGPEIVLPIAVRAGRFDLRWSRTFQGEDDSATAAAGQAPYRPAAIHVIAFSAEDGFVFHDGHTVDSRSVNSYVDNGYVVVQSQGMVYLYDLDTSRWVAALDTTTVHPLDMSDGTATAVSADRRWFAVRGIDGEKVAVYRLPDPAPRR